MEFLVSACKNDKDVLRFVMLYSFVFGLTARGYGFTNLTVSHDSLYMFYGTDEGKIALGRFLVPVFKLISGSRVVLPWSAGIFSLLMLGLSSYLVCGLLRFRMQWQIILTAAFMLANITITALVATYIHDLEADTMALLFSVISVCFWNEFAGNRKN